MMIDDTYVEIDINTLRCRQILTLKELDRVCKQYGLKYMLSGGSCLGAIRHGGYIPWDDDIDVVMPRKDYEQLLRVRNTFEPQYKLVNPKEKGIIHPYTYLKLFDLETHMIEKPGDKNIETHVYIDIFPLDDLSDDEANTIVLLKKLRKWKFLFALFSMSYYNQSSPQKNKLSRFLWGVTYQISKIIPQRLIVERMESIIWRKDCSKSDYVGVVIAGYGIKERTRRMVFQPMLHEFEGHLFPIPVGYDEYLTNVFGDYMTPPPVEEQILCHSNKAYLKVLPTV